jgi:hypothetical protein
MLPSVFGQPILPWLMRSFQIIDLTYPHTIYIMIKHPLTIAFNANGPHHHPLTRCEMKLNFFSLDLISSPKWRYFHVNGVGGPSFKGFKLSL